MDFTRDKKCSRCILQPSIALSSAHPNRRRLTSAGTKRRKQQCRAADGSRCRRGRRQPEVEGREADNAAETGTSNRELLVDCSPAGWRDRAAGWVHRVVVPRREIHRGRESEGVHMGRERRRGFTWVGNQVHTAHSVHLYGVTSQ